VPSVDSYGVPFERCHHHPRRADTQPEELSCEIPHGKLTVISGVSGSGKSSLAFDTIYAEGQRRYVESLSAYARQFLERIEKPDVDEIDGLAPAIAIKQKNTTRNPRSTVATATEIYDYLRLLYARCGDGALRLLRRAGEARLGGRGGRAILALGEGTRLNVLFPVTSAAPRRRVRRGSEAGQTAGRRRKSRGERPRRGEGGRVAAHARR
jgi:excinuclease ABC subunit A